jgi:hypothetical protein
MSIKKSIFPMRFKSAAVFIVLYILLQGCDINIANPIINAPEEMHSTTSADSATASDYNPAKDSSTETSVYDSASIWDTADDSASNTELQSDTASGFDSNSDADSGTDVQTETDSDSLLNIFDSDGNCIDDKYENNDKIHMASALTAPCSIYGAMCEDSADYFHINLKANDTILLDLWSDISIGNLDMQLWQITPTIESLGESITNSNNEHIVKKVDSDKECVIYIYTVTHALAPYRLDVTVTSDNR